MKRIMMMLALAALTVVALSLSAVTAFAGPENKCERDPNFKQCEKFGPGNSENTSAFGKNPNTGVERDNPSPNN
jgi:hypothetical protein